MSGGRGCQWKRGGDCAVAVLDEDEWPCVVPFSDAWDRVGVTLHGPGAKARVCGHTFTVDDSGMLNIKPPLNGWIRAFFNSAHKEEGWELNTLADGVYSVSAQVGQ